MGDWKKCVRYNVSVGRQTMESRNTDRRRQNRVQNGNEMKAHRKAGPIEKRRCFVAPQQFSVFEELRMFCCLHLLSHLCGIRSIISYCRRLCRSCVCVCVPFPFHAHRHHHHACAVYKWNFSVAIISGKLLPLR